MAVVSFDPDGVDSTLSACLAFSLREEVVMGWCGVGVFLTAVLVPCVLAGLLKVLQIPLAFLNSLPCSADLLPTDCTLLAVAAPQGRPVSFPLCRVGSQRIALPSSPLTVLLAVDLCQRGAADTDVVGTGRPAGLSWGGRRVKGENEYR